MGDGMIFVGPDKPSFYINDGAGPVAQDVGNGAEGEADGYYIEGGWYIPDTKWEIDLRYDVYNRLTDDTEFSAGAKGRLSPAARAASSRAARSGSYHHTLQKVSRMSFVA